MYQLRAIGRIKNGLDQTVIELDSKYRRALKHLHKFSHAHVFYSHFNGKEWELRKNIIHIQQVDMKKVHIISKGDWYQSQENFLFDIKPYFPCEDSVKEVINLQACEVDIIIEQKDQPEQAEQPEQPEQNYSTHVFEAASIGIIRNINGEIYVQLKDMKDIKEINDLIETKDMKETKNLIETKDIKVRKEINNLEGIYVKLYWWFHKFDSNKYRQITECNPPYENAPRSGIFSTRSPVRPNPIAMTIVKIDHIDYKRKRLYIDGIESFDKTPCLGFSTYSQEKDCILNCKVPEWLSHWPKWRAMSSKVMKTKDISLKVSEIKTLLNESELDEGKDKTVAQTKVQTNSYFYSEIEQFKETNHSHEIYVQGARENNLKGINVGIPYRKITAVVGVSGSGKSSLVNDIIYAECRRRMEYLTNSRNLLQKPKVESIRGCIPAVIINQEAIRGNSLSTIGTYTDAYDYLRVIYASVAIRHCPICGYEIIPLSRERILQLMSQWVNVEVFNLNKVKIDGATLEEEIDRALTLGDGALYVKPPKKNLILLQTKQKCYRCNTLMFEMTSQTFSYMDPDCRCSVCNGTGKVVEIDENKIIEKPELSLLDGASSFYGKLRTFQQNPNANWMKGQVFGLADMLREDLDKPWNELRWEFKNQLLHGSGQKEVTFRYKNKKNARNGEITRPVEGICQIINRICRENPDSQAMDRYMSQIPCKTCKGERLAREGRIATINNLRYPQAAGMTFEEIYEFCSNLYCSLPHKEMNKIEVAVKALREISEAAEKLGIGYLPLNRETNTLSGGEGQRVKLLGAFINHMSGILYVFDEPSKGMHSKDYDKVALMLRSLKEEGNTIIIVEHNEDMIKLADHIVEIGPGAGKHGGELVSQGTLQAMFAHKETQIFKYMNPKNPYKMPYIKKGLEILSFKKLEHLSYRNLKNISIQFPENAFTCICGVCGSGKSSLMKGEIFNHAKKELHYSEVILVDQLTIGKSSKSIIATYIGVMDSIRAAFSSTKQALQIKFDEKYFSFNNDHGQCATCKGEGKMKIKYMEDSYVNCPDCNGKRYQKKVLEIQYHGHNIDEILNMSIDDALTFWSEKEDIVMKLSALQKTGIGYLILGQSTSSLSGGEAARLRISKQMVSKMKRNILYLLDEPTTGLHFSDIEHLLKLIDEIVKSGNTVIAIEHNKDFINNCDWVIELGPGAGRDGGEVIYQGR